ncbi:MAG: 23S rRNA (adenine(2503)-C(2))-methyltransferase RlmN [Parachlamydiaceae bacterium]|nr:23S rRNA (adenine(2503)-C(2))-methyltransferase RlmN [Parachlamydiaceae bacterium]
MENFCELSLEKLSTWLTEAGHAAYNGKQIYKWVYEKFVLQWDGMTNLSKELREKLSTTFRLPVLEFVKMTPSNDGETYKFLWKMSEGSFVESVLILSGNRRTVCVSSQVGCPVRCAFCASGKNGFFRNLRPAEIIEQVLQINVWLKQRDEKVTHVVFMGMGEPFKNYDAVIQSIHQLSDPLALGISQRRITVSTVGITEGIRRFTQEGLKVSLVLSLHAPNQKIREKIIPYARKYPLDEILKTMDEFALKTKRDVTYEYILLAGINDHPDHAFELANLLRGRQCTVNLIPYNPVAGIRLVRPEHKAIKQFRTVLFGSKVVNTCRYTKGDDIAAACGQLALMQKEETEKKEENEAEKAVG